MHQGIVTLHGNTSHKTAVATLFKGKELFVYRFTASNLVEKINRVRVNTLLHHSGGIKLNSSPTATRMCSTVRVAAHSDGGRNHLVLARTNNNIVKPPSLVLIGCRCIALNDKLDNQLACIQRQVRSNHIDNVETLMFPQRIINRIHLPQGIVRKAMEETVLLKAGTIGGSGFVIFSIPQPMPIVIALVGTFVPNRGNLRIRFRSNIAYLVEFESDVTQRRI